ncbi:hypothetical protein R3P38DRAFT_2761586 [Favolaschia claudopus]|uniref:Uncharacterized protein n=1 Tax=Favolaschia claudopus TaxID=2862362 RepID=A0AAW0DQF6_9AGAR
MQNAKKKPTLGLDPQLPGDIYNNKGFNFKFSKWRDLCLLDSLRRLLAISSTSAAAQKFEGDINKYKVNELKQLRPALSLTVTEGNGKKTSVKEEFLDAIKERVFKSSKNIFKADPRFGGLYKGKKRQSADKAAEDIVEQSKPAEVSTSVGDTKTLNCDYEQEQSTKFL